MHSVAKPQVRVHAEFWSGTGMHSPRSYPLAQRISRHRYLVDHKGTVTTETVYRQVTPTDAARERGSQGYGD